MDKFHTINADNFPERSVVPNITVVENEDKKPSYLNLACCVNGYSHLTTYDSKIRQTINKCREVSPIRPSMSSVPDYGINISLAVPVLCPPKRKESSPKVENDCLRLDEHRTYLENENSLIQEKVERLYGSKALVHGFFIPRRTRTIKSTQEIIDHPDKAESGKTFNTSNDNLDLPVFRHLSEEFRAQLPIVSPKKYSVRKQEVSSQLCNKDIVSDTTDCKATEKNCKEIEIAKSLVNIVDNCALQTNISEENTEGVNNKHIEIDGHFFLEKLKNEQKRLLLLAEDAEKNIEILSKIEGINDDVLGLLRSASGKSKLLVSQKMKQFEGLCYKNINKSNQDAFPTTIDDLQGFWDMVNLQVKQIDNMFEHINKLKAGNWKVEDDFKVDVEERRIQIKKPIRKIHVPLSNDSKSSQQKLLDTTAKRESQRKHLQELKRKNKMALSTKSFHDISSNNNYI